MNKPTTFIRDKAIDSITIKVKHQKVTLFAKLQPTMTMEYVYNYIAAAFSSQKGDFRLIRGDQVCLL